MQGVVWLGNFGNCPFIHTRHCLGEGGQFKLQIPALTSKIAPLATVQDPTAQRKSSYRARDGTTFHFCRNKIRERKR